MKENFQITLKMSLSAFAALLLANSFNLEFAAVAAVIAVLSVQSTRREAIKIGITRIISSILSIVLSTIIYTTLGHNPLSFLLFLIVFITLNFRFKIHVGMVVGIVLSTHLLVADSVDLFWIINELSIMAFGVGTASIANIFMPSLEDDFQEDKAFIDDTFKVILNKMATTLTTHTVSIDENSIYSQLELKLKDAKGTAFKISGNSILKSSSYYTDYINMRTNQFYILKRMRNYFDKLYMTVDQTKLMAKLTSDIAISMGDICDSKYLLQNLNNLREEFKTMPLPQSREEFENRALLFNLLNDLEEFLMEKDSFAANQNCNI